MTLCAALRSRNKKKTNERARDNIKGNKETEKAKGRFSPLIFVSGRRISSWSFRVLSSTDIAYVHALTPRVCARTHAPTPTTHVFTILSGPRGWRTGRPPKVVCARATLPEPADVGYHSSARADQLIVGIRACSTVGSRPAAAPSTRFMRSCNSFAFRAVI